MITEVEKRLISEGYTLIRKDLNATVYVKVVKIDEEVEGAVDFVTAGEIWTNADGSRTHKFRSHSSGLHPESAAEAARIENLMRDFVGPLPEELAEKGEKALKVLCNMNDDFELDRFGKDVRAAVHNLYERIYEKVVEGHRGMGAAKE